jgi:hypothetical protein
MALSHQLAAFDEEEGLEEWTGISEGDDDAVGPGMERGYADEVD